MLDFLLGLYFAGLIVNTFDGTDEVTFGSTFDIGTEAVGAGHAGWPMRGWTR